MAFLPNIPLSTDQQSISQANILNNFMLLGAIAGNSNASSASLNGTSGFNWIYLPPTSPNGGPPTGSSFTTGNIGVYSSLYSTTSQNELYISKQNQATTVQIPLSASILSSNSAPGAGNGWSYLPSGMIIASGSSTGTSSGLVTFTPILTSGPTFTQILNVIVCPYNNTTTGDLNFAVRLVDVNSPTTFRVYYSSRTSTGPSSGATGLQFFIFGY